MTDTRAVDPSFASRIARLDTSHSVGSSAPVPVLLMVSGGADSTALLRLAHSGYLGEGTFSVLHIDHAIREESADDALWVTEACRELGIESEIVRIDVPALIEREGGNLEEVARRARYEAAEEMLDRLCEDAGVPPEAGRIVTAHTRDDRVETFFMRALAGAGLTALASIPRARGRVRRPLLDVDRTEIEAYLAELDQPYLIDRTNADAARSRAFVRHGVVAPLASRNPSLTRTLARTLDLMGDDAAYLDAAAAEAYEGIVRSAAEGERVVFDLQALRAASPAIARRVVRTALVSVFPAAYRIEAEHIDRIARADTGVRFMADIGGDLRVESQCDTLTILPSVEPVTHADSAVFELDGRVEWGGGRLVAELVDEAGSSDPGTTVFIDADAVAGGLQVGSPRPGERMRPLGLGGSKLLSDVLIDAKVPRRLRASTPVVRAGNEVVWVVGGRLDDRYRIGESTTRIARLTWREGSEA